MKKIVILLIMLFQVLMINAQVDLSVGLFANYPFNGNLNDQGANGNDLIPSGGRFSTDRFGNISAYEFNGTSDYLVSKLPFDLPDYYPPESISFWFNLHEVPLSNASHECFLLGLIGSAESDCSDCTGAIFGVSFLKDSIVVIQNGINKNITHSKHIIKPDNWYHVVVTTYQVYRFPSKYFNNITDLYLNDSIISSIELRVPVGSSLFPGKSGFLQIGAIQYSPTSDRTYFFNGSIDDIMFYHKTLTEQEIHALYQIKPGDIISSIGNIAKINYDNLIFYPNPADNTINFIKCNEPESFVYIYNLEGKLLISKQITNDGNSLDVSCLRQGIYIVKLVDSGNTFLNKLIKN